VQYNTIQLTQSATCKFNTFNSTTVPFIANIHYLQIQSIKEDERTPVVSLTAVLIAALVILQYILSTVTSYVIVGSNKFSVLSSAVVCKKQLLSCEKSHKSAVFL